MQKAASRCCGTADYNPDVTVISAAMTPSSLALPLSVCPLPFLPLLPLRPSIARPLCIPLSLSGLSLSVPLGAVWSLAVGVCVWVRTPWEPAGLCIENEFYIFQEASGRSTPACVYSLFPTDESRQGADTTDSRCRRCISHKRVHMLRRRLMSDSLLLKYSDRWVWCSKKQPK